MRFSIFLLYAPLLLPKAREERTKGFLATSLAALAMMRPLYPCSPQPLKNVEEMVKKLTRFENK